MAKRAAVWTSPSTAAGVRAPDASISLASAAETPATRRILVTGGTGFIGRNLLNAIRHNHLDRFAPFALARPTSDKTLLYRILDHPSRDDPVFTADLRNKEALKFAVEQADVVIHLAADMDFFPRDPDSLTESNVTNTRNLLAACAAAPHLPRFVYVSTAEVVGPAEGAGEDVACKPRSAYGKSKLAAEAVVAEYASALETVVLRPTGVYGPGERFFFYEFMTMVASGLAIIAPSPLSGRVVFVHVDDVVNAILTVATHPDAIGRTFNVCADDPVSYRRIVELVADVLRYPRPAVFLPVCIGERLIRLVAPLMNRGKRRRFVYHPQTVRESVDNRVYTNESLRSLGCRPKYSVLAGVEQTLRIELETGGIKRTAIPLALAKCIHFASLAVFAISRFSLRARMRESG